jgi:hypothetical protein
MNTLISHMHTFMIPEQNFEGGGGNHPPLALSVTMYSIASLGLKVKRFFFFRRDNNQLVAVCSFPFIAIPALVAVVSHVYFNYLHWLTNLRVFFLANGLKKTQIFVSRNQYFNSKSMRISHKSLLIPPGRKMPIPVDINYNFLLNLVEEPVKLFLSLVTWSQCAHLFGDSEANAYAMKKQLYVSKY